MDTEFVGEDSYHPRLCLIQVATEAGLFLIDPLSVGPLDSFWRLVVDPDNLVVVHAGREEVRLCQLWIGSPPANLFDLQIAAGLVGLNYPLSHGKLVDQVLGIYISKGETLTEWRNRPLTPAQVRYAFDDVRYLLPVWEKLSTQLDQLHRLTWAQEEFARLKDIATLGTENILPTGDKWRKLRGLGSLDRQALAVVRELYIWREETAARQNRPARTILRDDLMVEIARRRPTRARDLQVVRGLPRRLLESIVEVVLRAHDLPSDEHPEIAEREQDPPQVGLVGHIMTAILSDLCVKKNLAGSLVATQNDLKLLVRAAFNGKAPPAETLLTQGWRAQHILPELLDVLNGRRSLRIRDVTAPAPLALEQIPESS
jgi:ribonuclease D